MRAIAVAAALAAALLAPAGAGALEGLSPGQAPPPLRLRDLGGDEVSLGGAAGSPTLVLFWSTWSPRSAEALADAARMHDDLSGRGLRVLAVNIDRERLGEQQLAAVRAYAAELGLPYPVLLDEGLRAFAAWGVMAHPTEVVLDAGGRIAYVLPGYPLSLRDELRGRVERALGIAPPPPPPPATAFGPRPKGAALMYYNLGCRHLDLGDLERARESFRRCAAEDPEFLEAAVMQARVSLALEDLDAVDAIARNLAPEDVDRDDLRYILGMVALQKGEVGAAERVFAQMGAGRPGEGWGGLGLGLAALARGDAAAAARSLAAAGVRPGSAPEAEAYVRRWLRVRWLRGEDVPAEDELVRVFPALEELRGRYRNLRRAVVAP